MSVETKAQRDARMAWWREARFGMFIHWGVYSVPAGTYKGKQIGGIGEWIMNTRQDPGGRIPARSPSSSTRSSTTPTSGCGMAKDAGHEIHRHHHQAPRRLRHVRLEGQPTGTSCDATPFGTRSC